MSINLICGDGSVMNVRDLSYRDKGMSAEHGVDFLSFDRADFQDRLIRCWEPYYLGGIAQPFAHIPKSEEMEKRDSLIKQESLLRAQSVLLDTEITKTRIAMKGEPLALFLEDYFGPKQAMKALHTLGPRRVRPMPGKGIGFELLLNDSGFDRFIPPLAFLAEDMGLCEIRLEFDAALTPAGESRKATFLLQISLVPKNSALMPWVLFSRSTSRNVLESQKDLQEVIGRWWRGEPLFIGDKVYLDCLLFAHKNPFYKRETLEPLMNVLSIIPIDVAKFAVATTGIKALVEEEFMAWRCEYHGEIKAKLLRYEGVLGTHLFQIETALALIRLFAVTLIPSEYESVKALLCKMPHKIDLLNFIDGFSGRPNAGLAGFPAATVAQKVFPLDQWLDHFSKGAFAPIARDLKALVGRVLVKGDPELDLLANDLNQYISGTLDAAVLAPLGPCLHGKDESGGYETDPDAADYLEDLTEQFLDEKHAVLEEGHSWVRPTLETRRGLFEFKGEFENPRHRRAFVFYLDKELGKDRVLKNREGGVLAQMVRKFV